jgi:predicted porin
LKEKDFFMKNILLGTTGLIGAALLAASASAETPKVTVGGFIDFQAGYASDDLDANQRSHGFRNDSEVSVRVDGKSDSGLGYGAVIDLEADVSADADNEGLNASRTYVYLDGGWGRFEMGSNQGAAATMAIDADNIAVATGGIDGAWTYFANTPGSFITTAALPAEHGVTTGLGDESFDNNNKITYYSPRFSGFQVGLSYAPDMEDRGQTVTRTDVGSVAGDVFDLAVNYENQWDLITLGLAGAYTMADGDTGVEDLGAWVLGGHLGYQGFKIAASYADWDDSLQAVAGSDEADYYTLGAAYEGGPFGVSATWLDSTIEAAGGDNEFNNLVLGADYKLAPGLTPYAELSFYEFDGSGATVDNDGTVFILGTQLAF